MPSRILIVEDDLDLARAMVRLLTRTGYEVAHVASCADARRVSGVFDVGILDVELSDGYGFNLWSDLVERGVVGSVIFFSGTVNPNLLSRAESLAPCIAKSEGIDALLSAIRRQISNPPRQVINGVETPAPSTPRNRK